MTGEAPLLDREIEVGCEGGVLDCWQNEERGLSSRQINHSREDTSLDNIACCGSDVF